MRKGGGGLRRRGETLVVGWDDVEGFSSASIVTSGYGSHGQSVATLGVVGPTRMDYAANMAAVHAVARYLGRMMATS